MKKTKAILAAVLMLIMTATPCFYAAALPGTVCVTDYVEADTGADVADALQAVIDANPNRTIWFPDGEYLVSHTLKTPADPKKSVDLQLANYAVIKATKNFTGGAVIALGGKDPYNTTREVGSNYGLTGGVIEGNNVADGVSIDSGRETKVQNTSIKHTVVGLHIKTGANSGSSDADIRDINIIGNSASNSVGMLIEGHDNTFTNIRIGCVRNGVIMRSNGNCLTNIHPLFNIAWGKYEGSCGFTESGNNNLYTYCYSDQFQTAFKITNSKRSIFDNCFAYWWSGDGGSCTGFKVEGSSFNSVVTNMRIDFRSDTDNTVYSGPQQGTGVFTRLLVDDTRLNSNRDYLYFVEETVVVHRLTYVPPKAATTQAEGNVEYYHCEECGKNYSDEDGENELTKVTVDKLPPREEPEQPAQNNSSVCEYCGEVHEGLIGRFIRFFHSILALFGLRR